MRQGRIFVGATVYTSTAGDCGQLGMPSSFEKNSLLAPPPVLPFYLSSAPPSAAFFPRLSYRLLGSNAVSGKLLIRCTASLLLSGSDR